MSSCCAVTVRKRWKEKKNRQKGKKDMQVFGCDRQKKGDMTS